MNSTYYEDRLDDLYAMAESRMNGCDPKRYSSPEMVDWLAAKKEAYTNMRDDIKFAGGMPRELRRLQRSKEQMPKASISEAAQ